jgi:hypothetical protein
MTTEPIVAIESLGYTKREASFLYLVGVHSGYFVRRQFDYFIDRVAGAIAQNFVEKARLAGHVEVLDYARGYRVYHLFAKSIYRLLGNAESQNRRRKGDGAIRARLLSLDYVLQNSGDRYLEPDDERSRFFGEERGIPQALYTDATGRMHPLLGSFPIALANPASPSESFVRFLFADEGLLTVEKFRRYLSVLAPLMRAMRSFEVLYASNSNQNFVAAKEEFARHFAPTLAAAQAILGRNWRESPRGSARNNSGLHATFTTLLFHLSYPQLRRSERASLSASRPLQLMLSGEVIHEQPHRKGIGSSPG